MSNQEFVSSFTSFVADKGVDKETVMGMLKEVLKALIERQFGSHEHFDIVMNPEEGDLQIWRTRYIVADDAWEPGEFDKIPLSEAQKIQPDFKVGEEVAEEINMDVFDRRSIVQGLHLFTQKRQELERYQLFKQYEQRVGQLVEMEVYHFIGPDTLLHDEHKNDVILPRQQQIPGERFRKGSRISVVIHEVTYVPGKLTIIASRASNRFLALLMEAEVDEIFEGTVMLEKIVRQPSVRAKIAVSSTDERIDPVGACVGPKGARIRAVMRQIKNEQIDVIHYTQNQELLVMRALSPAQIGYVKEENGRLKVFLQPDQIPLAVGLEGQNVRLASLLMDKPIDIYREIGQEEEDVYLEEFKDEIPETQIEGLKEKGLMTAKDVLKIPLEVLQEQLQYSDIEMNHLYKTLSKEFEK